MGDLIQTTPLIKGLKNKYPNAKITLIVSSDFENAVSLIPSVDDSIIFNLRQFKESDDLEDISWVKIYRYIESKLNNIRLKSYDMLVNLSHSRLSALMVHYLKVDNVIGFHCNSIGDRMTGHPWMQYFGTEPFNRNFNEFNLVEIFSRSAGIDPVGKEIQVLENTLPNDGLVSETFNGFKDGLIVGFQIGSSLENRRWSTESFAKLADLLIEKLNARIILFGIESERKSAEEMIRLSKRRNSIIDLTGKTDLNQLTELLKGCAYLITNDTGTMHLAAALKTKIIGLFFAHAHPFETAPFTAGNLIFQARISCAPCSYGVDCNNIICVDKVKPNHILSFIDNYECHNTWKLPFDLKDCQDLNIYETVFSAHNVVRLKPMIKHEISINDIFRLAYSVLWRETLDQEINTDCDAMQELLEEFSHSNSAMILESLDDKMTILEGIESLSLNGIMLCEKIIKVVSESKSMTSKLAKLGEDIFKVDEKIELVGMSNPELKLLTDMFNKRKENQNGNDINHLGMECINYYKLLKKESIRLMEILSVHKEIILKISKNYNAHNSIKVCVPGR